MNFFGRYNTWNLQKLEETDLFKTSHQKLRENRWYKPVLDYVEDLTKINRVYSVTVLGALLTGILLLVYGTALIIGCVGFVYPAYKSLGDLKRSDSDKIRKWVVYFTLYAALNFLEIVFPVSDFIPVYWLLKCLFLSWCYASQKGNGIIYSCVIGPLSEKIHEADSDVNQVTRVAHTIYTESDANEADDFANQVTRAAHEIFTEPDVTDDSHANQGSSVQ